jgi:hypothetical protein
MPPASQHRLYSFLQRYFHILFWPLLTLTFCVMLLELKDQTVLRTDAAPYGIVSLELGHSFAKDTGIVQSWKDSVPDMAPQDLCALQQRAVIPYNTAKPNVVLDYLFIVLYTTLLVIVLGALQAGNPRGTTGFTHLLLVLALIAGGCDCIENIGLLQFIAGHWSDWVAMRTSVLAITKMAILVLLLLYILFVLFCHHDALRWLSGYVQRKAVTLFRYRVILLGVVFFCAPIWMMDQGQDLLVNSNSGDPGIGLFVGVVLVAAAMNWYLAKLFFGRGYCKGDPIIPLTPPTLSSPKELFAEKKVSRFLGVCTILVPAAAILNALQAIHMHYFLDQFDPGAWLLGLMAFFFVLIRYDLACKGYGYLVDRWKAPKANRITYNIIFLLGLGIPLLIRIVILGNDHRSPYSLNFLFLQLVLLALAFYVFVSVREQLYPGSEWLGSRIGGPIILAAVVLATGFLLYNIFPFSARSFKGCYLSLPVLLSGIIFYTLAIVLLLRLGLAKGINFLLFIAVIGVALAIKGNNHYHDVQRMTVKQAPQRISLDAYFKEWLLKRQKDIDSANGEYPIFLVNSYGGGIRAAAYTNLVLSYLDDTLTRQGGFKKGFEHYVFSISGASGGTIGGAVQCAYRATHLDTVGVYANYRNDFETFYQHDFLTPVLSNMLGSDVWASPVGIRLPFWRDRSAIQEDLWARYGEDSLHLALGSEFNSLWDTTKSSAYEIPLLFSNTLNVDDGRKGICAPVDLDHRDFPATIFIRERIDSLNAHHDPNEDSLQSISLITGAFLSARFPYMSPSGKMGPGYHFIDGGAKDNSGASTSENIFLAIQRWAMENTKSDTVARRLMHKVHFYFVSISNNPRATLDEQPDPRQLVSNRWEPISPIVGIINSGIDGNATAADSNLRFRYSKMAFAGNLFHADYCAIWPTATCIVDDNHQRYCPLLPLGWQISAPSLTRLSTCLSPGNVQCNPAGICKIMAILKNE